MMYLAHTAHLQFLGLATGFLAWILTMSTAGLNEWRLWYVDDVSVINSGVAWVGIWRVCFYTHVLPQMEFCPSLSMSDSFLPVEIPVAQVLMALAMICGLAGNISGAVAMRMVYFTVVDRRNIRLVFILTGILYLFTGSCSLVPLVWNMNSVLINSTIDFPPEFHLPVAPVRQQVGTAIGVGIFASILMFISGLLFLSYKYARHTLRSVAPRSTSNPLRGPWTVTTMAQRSNGVNQSSDNPSFLSEVS
ncbi:claudin-34 [Hippoglossus hippoglossus]|uniref:claudin-34 n=1 Tax=Hippoglossus hippoglossus TaxID=8267 RepID=UPI00148D6635|nr:claudin-34 [Hippoglossus hippoglossus]XP_034438387.1 claudin-34 [Hippoglossus hippoglossus]